MNDDQYADLMAVLANMSAIMLPKEFTEEDEIYQAYRRNAGIALTAEGRPDFFESEWQPLPNL